MRVKTRSGGPELESPAWQGLSALTKVKDPWGQFFLQSIFCQVKDFKYVLLLAIFTLCKHGTDAIATCSSAITQNYIDET